MSVKLETKDGRDKGQLKICSNEDNLDAADYICRVHAMINYLGAADEELIGKDDRYFMISVLRDYMPSEEQVDKLLKPSPH